MHQMVVMCGGKATRLGRLTKDIPKSLIKINGKPFIDYQMELFRKNGVRRVLLLVGHFAQQIFNYLEKRDYGIDFFINYNYREPHGTGDAIFNAMKKNLLDDYFLLTNGDSYLPIDYNFFYNQNTLTVYKNNDQKRHINNVLYFNNKVIRYEKDGDDNFGYLDYGLSLLSADKMKEYYNYYYGKYGASTKAIGDLGNYYSYLAKTTDLYGVPIKTRFYEIGSHVGIREFTKYVKENNL